MVEMQPLNSPIVLNRENAVTWTCNQWLAAIQIEAYWNEECTDRLLNDLFSSKILKSKEKKAILAEMKNSQISETVVMGENGPTLLDRVLGLNATFISQDIFEYLLNEFNFSYDRAVPSKMFPGRFISTSERAIFSLLTLLKGQSCHRNIFDEKLKFAMYLWRHTVSKFDRTKIDLICECLKFATGNEYKCIADTLIELAIAAEDPPIPTIVSILQSQDAKKHQHVIQTLNNYMSRQ